MYRQNGSSFGKKVSLYKHLERARREALEQGYTCQEFQALFTEWYSKCGHRNDDHKSALEYLIQNNKEFYQGVCSYGSKNKDRHYRLLGSLIEEHKGESFSTICMMGLPEYRMVHDVLHMYAGGLSSTIKCYLGFELDRSKYSSISNHYRSIKRALPFKMSMLCGDILSTSEARSMLLRGLEDPNVFDFDFCCDTVSSKKDRDYVLDWRPDAPQYKGRVPDLKTAHGVSKVLALLAPSNESFAVGVNFSARNVPYPQALKFRDFIVEEIIKDFSVINVTPTKYTTGRPGSGMLGAWIILAKN